MKRSQKKPTLSLISKNRANFEINHKIMQLLMILKSQSAYNRVNLSPDCDVISHSGKIIFVLQLVGMSPFGNSRVYLNGQALLSALPRFFITARRVMYWSLFCSSPGSR